MKRRPAWIVPAVLCAAAVLLGGYQESAKRPIRAPDEAAESKPHPQAGVDLISLIAQRVIYWPQRAISGVADGTAEFVYGIVNASTLQRRVSELEQEVIAREQSPEQIKRLQRENARLRSLLRMRPFARRKSITADIVGHFPSEHRISLNVGRNRNVTPGDPVLAPTGLIGQVVEAAGSTCYVNLLTHSDFSVGARVARAESHEVGIVRGQGTETLLLNIFSEAADVQPGDTLTTSGLSDIYPEGIPIGRVTRVWLDTDYRIRKGLVTPAARFPKVRELRVLTK